MLDSLESLSSILFLGLLGLVWHLHRDTEAYCRHLEDRIAELESLMGV